MILAILLLPVFWKDSPPSELELFISVGEENIMKY